MTEAKPGDVVKLAKDEGILVDYETGFEVSGSQKVELGKTIGQRTRLALQSGGLLIVSDGKPKDDSDLPADLPGRDVLVKAGMDFESVKTHDFETNKVAGIGARTIEALKAFLSK